MSPLSSSWSSGRGSAIQRKRIVKEGSFGKRRNTTWVRGERDQTRVFAWWVLERIERRYSPTQKPKTRKPRKAWYIYIEREREREKRGASDIWGQREKEWQDRKTDKDRERERDCFKFKMKDKGTKGAYKTCMCICLFLVRVFFFLLGTQHTTTYTCDFIFILFLDKNAYVIISALY